MTNAFRQMPETWTYGRWFMADEWEPNNGMIAWIVVDRTIIINITNEVLHFTADDTFEVLWVFHSIPNNKGVWLPLYAYEEAQKIKCGFGQENVVMFMPVPKPPYPDMWDIEKAMEYSAQYDVEKEEGEN